MPAGEPRRLNQPFTAEQLRRYLDLGGGGLSLEMLQLVRPVVVVGDIRDTDFPTFVDRSASVTPAAGDFTCLRFCVNPGQGFGNPANQATGKTFRLLWVSWLQTTAGLVRVRLDDPTNPYTNRSQLFGSRVSNPNQKSQLQVERCDDAALGGEILMEFFYPAAPEFVRVDLPPFQVPSNRDIVLQTNVAAEPSQVSVAWQEIDRF